MPPRRPQPPSASIIAKASSSIQKKERVDKIKAAREKYSQLSRAALPPSTTTVPIDRPPATSRIRPPSASALPQPGTLFRPDPAAAAAIRAGPLPNTTGRASTVPRPSLAPRPSMAPRPSIVPPRAPRVSMLPRAGPDGASSLFGGGGGGGPLFGSSSSLLFSANSSSSSARHFEPVGDSLGRIMRNEPLPMASGARASSIGRRPTMRPSMMPGGINIFTATGEARLEAERLNGLTPGRRGLSRMLGGDESSVHRSRVRFELEDAILEQRESVGDEVDETPSSSSTASTSSTLLQPSTLNQQSILRRANPTLFSAQPRDDATVEPPRSILKQRKSPRVASSATSSTASVLVVSSNTTSSTTTTIRAASPTAPRSSLFAGAGSGSGSVLGHIIDPDENRPARGTPARAARGTPARNGSSKGKNKRKEINMMDVFAYLTSLKENAEERRQIPNAMMQTCKDEMDKLMEMKQEEERETSQEEDYTEDEEEEVSELDQGIAIVMEEEEEEEVNDDEDEAHETLPLPPCELTFTGSTPVARRRSSRLASNQGSQGARKTLFLE